MGCAFKIVLSIAALAVSANSEPFQPESDSYVVEKLPGSLIAIQRSALRGKRNVQDPSERLRLAREYLQVAQRTSDAAFVRYAEELLSPLKPDPEALFLWAVIDQHKHQFDKALQQLNGIPGSPEAALLKASILTTQGKYEEAKAIFAKDLRLISTLRGLTIFLTITSLNGGLDTSERSLARAISNRAERTEQSFAWCALAEMSIRRGDLTGAEERFRKSLELEPGDSYTLAAYCDVLRSIGRQNDVPAHIQPDSTSEALLTRRLLAMKASRDEVMPFANQLKASGHRRELAMLQLDLTYEPEAALENASRNWEQQKEPIDARLVLRAALACGKRSSADPVLQWLATTRLEDRTIEELKRSATDPSFAATREMQRAAVGDRPHSETAQLAKK